MPCESLRSVKPVVALDLLQRIWDAHQLGEIQSVTTPTRGMINACRIVNNTHVIRFDTLDFEGEISRYVGERMAFDYLQNRGVPVPVVVALDLTKTLAPHPYLILSFMPGSPLMDNWSSLSLAEQARLGFSVGRNLALIHECAFEGFGPLERLAQHGFASWYGYIHSFLKSDSQVAVANGSIDLSLSEKMKTIFNGHRQLLEIGLRGRLTHGDFHLDNVLTSGDKVTATIDFEWARSGDPAWDFRMEDHWEESCPGSRQFIYEGYAQYRTITPDHALRVRLYKILYYLDDVLFYSIEQPNVDEHRLTVERLRAVVASF
jgi:fructosamine-3-kinase